MKQSKASMEWWRITGLSIAFIAAVALLGLLANSPARAAGYYICSIIQVSGNAQIRRGGSTIPAQQGTPIMVEDRVTTQFGASVTLGFDDGSSIALSGGTTVEIENNTLTSGQAQTSHVRLISGDIHTIVPDTTTGAQHRIEVNTTNSKVTGPSPNQ
jgi:hypothetical protein